MSGPALQVELLLATRRWNSYISTLRGRRPTLNTDLSDNILASAKPHTPPFCVGLSSQAIKSYFRLRQKLITQNSSLLTLDIPEFLTLLMHYYTTYFVMLDLITTFLLANISLHQNKSNTLQRQRFFISSNSF